MSELFNFQLATRVDDYIQDLFVREDPALEQGLKDAAAAGLPEIQVSPNQAKLLHLIARIAGARNVLEIGTLGGYSTAWLARAVPPDGRVATLELSAAHAAVARRNLDRCGLGAKVDILVGPAARLLRCLIAEGEAAFDLIFIDADKEPYAEYLELALQLSRPGTVILADNLIRDGAVLDEYPEDSEDRSIRAFNALLAAHPRLDSLILPIIRDELDGLSISIVR
jgi:predicted O-methyltransferase YrrM